MNDAVRLIKHVSFDVDRHYDDLPEKGRAEVDRVVLEAIWAGIESEDNQRDFDQGFAGAKSTLVKKIARKLPHLDGASATELVTSAFVDYGLRAHQYLAGCIQAIMQDFRNGLEVPLNEHESKVFELLYNSQDAFGGLPLILLGERLDTVRLVIRELLCASDEL
ncbi:hypothetical protein [Adhaeretor mobilis]|uniref:Uncharacterized protein n=1 Tax=Adhaeretor mobilis TaxID=1930276 RepID=A0A517MZQ4_9BACT|nr:hypothetical protein [Adhaeretor mobilis]QDT00366.1 hypothetical protein HG15A2_37020 [Adhaeretor mobilis]